MHLLHELLQATRTLLAAKLTDVGITSIAVISGSHSYYYVIAVGALDEGTKTAVLRLTESEAVYKLQDVERSSASLAFDLFNIIEAGGNDDTQSVGVGNSIALTCAVKRVLV
jgi:hypothetical protein